MYIRHIHLKKLLHTQKFTAHKVENGKKVPLIVIKDTSVRHAAAKLDAKLIAHATKDGGCAFSRLKHSSK